MSIIKNFDQLASSPQRKVVLELIESAFESIKPTHVLDKQFSVTSDVLTIQEKTYDLKKYEQVFLIGFGKGSYDVCKIISEKLGDKLSLAYDIDVIDAFDHKIEYTKGTHPLPSEENIEYTQKLVERFSGNLTEKDLILVVVCGGGSVLFEMPHTIDLPKLIEVNKALLRCAATISEMNVIRKHLSVTKGGGFAHMLYPATVAALIFSDVPGNDLNVIASGPTVKDPSTLQDVQTIMEKYDLLNIINHSLEEPTPIPSGGGEKKGRVTFDAFQETPKDDMYFENVSNILMVSNQTALHAMQQKAKALGYESFIFSDKVQGDAKITGQLLINNAPSGKILLAAGETTVKVSGNGKGGRNQALVLASLPFLKNDIVLASFGSDGQDFFVLAGAIADKTTFEKAKEKGLDWKKYLDDDNSYEFWESVGDGILTGKLESNVSDLMIVLKE